MDIYDVILRDHQTARRMLKELCQTGDADGTRRGELFPAFKNELMMHQHVEESVFYARLKAIEETRPDALEAMNEHHIVNTLLSELEVMPKGNDQWAAKLGVLREFVEHHMHEEEDEFIPEARKVLGGDEARTMGEQMQEKKAAGLKAMQTAA